MSHFTIYISTYVVNLRFTFKLKNYRHLWLISCIFMGIWGIFFQRLECCHWSSSFRNPPNIFKSDQLTCILHLFLSMYLTAFLNSRIFNRRPIACTSFGNQSTQVYSTEIKVRPKMLGLRRRYPIWNWSLFVLKLEVSEAETRSLMTLIRNLQIAPSFKVSNNLEVKRLLAILIEGKNHRRWDLGREW